MKIILIHGFCEDHTIWNSLIPYSKYKDEILCIDLPGFGDNASEYEQAMSVEAMADFVKQKLLAQNITNFILIGHSLGGYVTLAFAEKYPELLSGMGLFHSTALPDSDERKAARLKTIEFVQTHGAEAFHRVLIPGLFQTNADNAMVEATIKAARTAQADGIIAALKAMRERKNRIQVLEDFKKPVLFIAGVNDKLIPAEQMVAQAAQCETAQMEILKNSAHMGQLEEPQQSAAIIDSFIRFTILMKGL